MKILLIVAALAVLLNSASAETVPVNTGWTAGAVNRIFGTKNVNFVLRNGSLKSLSIFKVDSVSRFHGGECFGLILQIFRGPSDSLKTDEDGIVGITGLQNPIDEYNYIRHALTGVEIESFGEDGFHYKASRKGEVLLTASIVRHGHETTEFRIEIR